MKTENNRLGRCSSCRYWRSAVDLIAERTGPDPTPEALASARADIRQELSQNLLDTDQADHRGWCTAAETGTAGPCTMMAVNLTDLSPARMITLHDFGCIDYQPRPRRAMNAPPSDLSRSRRLGRCVGCRYWSSAENEATAIFSMERYTDPTSTMEGAQQQAYDMLSPPPLDRSTATLRGWCKIASDYNNTRPKNLAFNPAIGAVAALITGRDYACMRHDETANPHVKTSPNWRWLIDPVKMHSLGPSASLSELLLSYLDPATLLDENHPLSPLHPDHPLNIRNPRSLYFNPNPAFAAYIVNPSLVNTVTDPNAYRQDEIEDRPVAQGDLNHPRLTMPFSGDASHDAMSVYKQAMMQARLAQDFAARTVRVGTAETVSLPTPVVGVSLVKKKDGKISFPERRQDKPKPKRAVISSAFTDRRQT